jgi:Uma2 family endonuclease
LAEVKVPILTDSEGRSQMVTKVKKYTVDDLWQMHPDAPVELWRGELVEAPPSGGESSIVGLMIGSRMYAFVDARDLGVVTGEAGGYILFSEEGKQTVVAPDVGFVRWGRLPERRRPKLYIPVPPDLAVEVTSRFDEPGDIKTKLALYMDAGVSLVWWVDLKRQVVRIHRPDQPDRVARPGDILDGEDVLPGFQLAVADIFAE